MSRQPELNAAAAEARGTDRFAEARTANPGDRLVLFHDRRTGIDFFMAVPPGSPWYVLLPAEQEAEILPPRGQPA